MNCVGVFRYLALISALAAEADYVFIPEWPPEQYWEEKLCSKLEMVSIGELTVC